MADLIERLQHAACRAIEDQRHALERRPEQLRSLHLEIELKRVTGGALRIDEARSFVERRVSVNSVLGVSNAPRPRRGA